MANTPQGPIIYPRHDPWDCQYGLPPQTDPPGTTPTTVSRQSVLAVPDGGRVWVRPPDRFFRSSGDFDPRTTPHPINHPTWPTHGPCVFFRVFSPFHRHTLVRGTRLFWRGRSAFKDRVVGFWFELLKPPGRPVGHDISTMAPAWWPIHLNSSPAWFQRNPCWS